MSSINGAVRHRYVIEFSNWLEILAANATAIIARMMYQLSFWTYLCGEDVSLCAAIPSVNPFDDDETKEGSITYSSLRTFISRLDPTIIEHDALSEIADAVSKAAETSNQVCTTTDIELDAIQLRTLGFTAFADYLERRSLLPSHTL